MAMIIDTTATLDGVEFAPETLAEILQNVKTILTTPKGSVPLDRDFGLDTTLLDAPVPVAQARYTGEIVDAVEKYEPRVKVEQVSFDGDGENGKLNVKVRVSIKDEFEESA